MKICKKSMLVLLSLVVLALCLAGCSKPQGETDASGAGKTVTIQVVHKDKSTKEFQITSTAKYLGDALEAEGLIKGEKDTYGLFVQTVDGETADSANEEWWCITKGGQSVPTGVSSTTFEDGDTFEFTLTVGY